MTIRGQKYRKEKETVLQAYSDIYVLSAGAGDSWGEVGCNRSGLALCSDRCNWSNSSPFTWGTQRKNDTINSWAVLLVRCTT